MRRAILSLAMLVALASPAHAQDVEQAKALFLAGAAAYDKHEYGAAIQAFEGAQRLAPRAPIVFSLAQAHRRQFYVDGNADHQRAAIDLFRDYIKQVPNGGRHDDAMRALQELGALAPQHTRDVASVSINSSGTPGAHIALDGATAVDAPLIGPVTAGKHHATISAEGFVSESRELVAVDGQIVALDVPLKEKTAHVDLAALPGSTVEVDGRPMGETPIAPLELTPGPHLVAVSKNGHDSWVRDLDLGRGEAKHINVALPASKQRTVSMGLLVAGAVTLVAGAAFASVSLVYYANAEKILQKRGTQNLVYPDDTNAYEDARAWRTTWIIAAAGSFVGAAALAATGLALFVFDKPTPSSLRETRKTTTPEHKAEPTEVSVAPIISPSTLGVAALVRF